tara:strand:+ start:22724 stop:23140 length:417 start_codon:yes stop_codon:yes gene_type:complete
MNEKITTSPVMEASKAAGKQSRNNDLEGKTQKEMFNEFLHKLDQLEKLKVNYRKIDEKRSLLEQAIREMDMLAEQVYTNESQFNIVLTKKIGDEKRELITLVSPEIVGKLTKFLLTEINSLLEMFEHDFLKFKEEIGK